MLLITASGNAGSAPKVATEPFRHLKFSVAVKAGWGDRQETIWINLKADERRFQKILIPVYKGSRISFVCKVTGISEDCKSYFADLVDCAIEYKVTMDEGKRLANSDEDMPF